MVGHELGWVLCNAKKLVNLSFIRGPAPGIGTI